MKPCVLRMLVGATCLAVASATATPSIPDEIAGSPPGMRFSSPSTIFPENTLARAFSYRIPVATAQRIAVLEYDDSALTGTRSKLGPLSTGATYFRPTVAKTAAGASPFLTSWESTTTTLASVTSTGKTPERFSLEQNYPNPFNPSTNIGYSIPSASHVTLKVLDLLGNEVATLVDEWQSAGSYAVHFDAQHLPSGVYFYQLRAGGFVQTRRLVLIR